MSCESIKTMTKMNWKGRKHFTFVWSSFYAFLLFFGNFKHVVSQLDVNSSEPESDCPSFLVVQQKSLAEDVNPTPRCNVSLRNDKNPNYPKCFNKQENVFQIIGNFSVLSLNCTAPYLLNLDFDGFQPTEALNVFMWRDEIEMTDEGNVNNTYGIKVKSFGLNATVTSIQTLFQQYQTYMKMNEQQKRPLPFFQRNLSSPILYPRTGRIRIRGMKPEQEHLFQDFYFFFEEPALENEISWMENKHTQKPIYKLEPISESLNESSESFILIPCRTSHWTKNVTLRFKNTTTEDDWSAISRDLMTFDPTVGFKLPANHIGLKKAEDLKTVQFQCSAISPNGKITTLELNSNAEDIAIYGIHLLQKPLPEAAESLSISFDHFTNENGLHYSVITCKFDVQQPNASLFVYGYRQQSYTELNFAREFALPVFANRSYFVLEGSRPTDGSTGFRLRVDPARGTGVVCCQIQDSFKFTEFTTSPFNHAKYPFPAGSYQPALPFHARSIPDELYAQVQQVEPRTRGVIYTYQKVEFICNTCSSYSLNRNPILWFSENRKGVRKLIFKDDFVSDDPLRVYENSRLKTRLTSDMAKIICMGALWQSDTWRHSSMPVNVSDGTAPVFVGSKRTFSFARNSLNQTIYCSAIGDPFPQVWWEKYGVKLEKSKPTHLNTAYYEIPKVEESSLGKYKCVAQNPYERIEADFLVQVSESNAGFYLLAVGLPTLIFFIIIILAIVLYSRARLRKEILTAEELKDFREGVDASRLNQEKDSPALAIPYTDEFEIPPGKFSIHRDKILGSGEFGLVMQATLKNRQVAAKTVHPDGEKTHFKSLMMELKILMYLGKHPHLIEFLGAYTKNIHRGVVYVFVELCEGGNLLSLLENHRHKFSNEKSTSTENCSYQNTGELTLQDLHEWAFQVAVGMNYLGSKRVIHGDLAARNILLTADRKAKITDFGLSRQLMSYSTYMKQSEEPLPFRWMSLESLESLKFSCESDVWSYGVLLWEIYSLGQTPFPNLSWDIEFVESLRNGLRMDCPQTISQQLYSSLLVPCWENDPKARPSFDSICSILDKLRKTPSTSTMP